MAQQRAPASSLLELEAAHYFKLDLSQLNLGAVVSTAHDDDDDDDDEQAQAMGDKSSRAPQQFGHAHASQSKHPDHRHHRHHRADHHQLESCQYQQAHQSTSDPNTMRRVVPSERSCRQHKPARPSERQPVIEVEPRARSRPIAAGPHQASGRQHASPRPRECGRDVRPKSRSPSPARRVAPTGHHQHQRHHHQHLNAPHRHGNKQLHATLNCGSSSTSSNSLPSVSSSPSVSPSIVCPHLSLDDLLDYRQGSNVSPHTIGLCAKCRLNPPPNVHSPLSPLFRPHSLGAGGQRRRMNQSSNDLSARSTAARLQAGAPQTMRRGYSDHQAGSYKRHGKTQLARKSSNNLSASRTRDDSLDFGLAPDDLRRLQMSPTLRNSVEFIRKNSIESGRVVRIYKNGEPFEKPLRVCILRGEFANLNHFLDHVNTRLFVPLGARYLFHLDGQLVYSVHELKHGSAYLVSGTRIFDQRANNQLRAEQIKEQQKQASARANRSTHTNHEHHQKTWKLESSHQQVSSRIPLAVVPTAQLVASYSHANQQVHSKPSAASGQERTSKAQPKICTKTSENNNNRQEKPIRLIRAKSDASALPKKQKKNVTFMDTGRGSSPALNVQLSTSELNLDEAVERAGDMEVAAQNGRSSGAPIERRRDSAQRSSDDSDSLLAQFRTSDVGIQVSDSIDGFLIDLPVALPAKGDDADAPSTTRTTALARNRSLRKSEVGNKSAARDSQTKSAARPKPRPQIVTISERQLSLDEMDQLKDLSQGDHHHEPERVEQSVQAEPEVIDADLADQQEPEVVPDFSNTIAIGSDPQASTSKAAGDEQWEYPDGRATSTTPTERPVSQSGPSESVRARVTTPTPSLSTNNDNNSLSMSYDTLTSTTDGQATTAAPRPRGVPVSKRPPPAQLPVKRQVHVTGSPCAGLHTPIKNFRLVWVNGFAINDLYPDNSVSGQQLLELERARSSSPAASGGPLLSPRRPEAAPDQSADFAFKPSERYHNWICHSRRHNELVYPAGSLVVLWCQWTNEQRFYAAHTANVSALALATLDLDLAASAQVCELNERPAIGACIHLWSVSSLDTLAVLEDEQLKTKLIFSLRLKNSKNNGCELSAAARDDKQMFLVTLTKRLTSPSGEPTSEQLSSSEPTNDAKRRAAKDKERAAVSLRASKVLQAQQVPLFLLKVPPNVDFTSRPQTKTGAGSQQPEVKCEPVISFGRRCFQVWLPDVRQQKLRLAQLDNKSGQFAKLMLKVNCLCRLSPAELLAGDAEGNVSLLQVDVQANSSAQSADKRLGAKQSPGRDSSDKYTIEALALLGPDTQPTSSKRTGKSSPGITCLTRITGSLFMGADSNCTVRFWQIRRQSSTKQSATSAVPTVKLAGDSAASAKLQCEQLASINLPADLGFICTIILADYRRAESIVDFYIVSTCNTILFGSVKLHVQASKSALVGADLQRDLLANSSLAVVYEGHETYASNLVADTRVQGADQFYFTCSLDCRICKWNGSQLVWKSMLPSSCASLAVHPTGFVLAVGSIDGTVYVLDKISGLLIAYFPLTPVRIHCLAYSSDGSLLAAGCSNGSIFILPVYERGLKYKKVSILQSPHAVVSLQFSLDNRYMLTSVTHGSYQELILWDLPNFRYMRDNVKLVADKIQWFDSICSGSEDVRAIWENANLADDLQSQRTQANLKRPSGAPIGTGKMKRDGFVVNLSCHRLVKTPLDPDVSEPNEGNFVVASDTRGYLRLFRYPCYDIQQGFFAARISSSAVNCCRFLSSPAEDTDLTTEEDHFVSTSLDGSICLWKLE